MSEAARARYLKTCYPLLELVRVKISRILALEDRPWSSLTREERVNLIMEIEAWHEIEAQTTEEIENDN